MNSENSNNTHAPDEQVETSRRKFLKTAGKIAIYTPPAMLAVARPSFAHAQSSGSNYYDEIEDQHSSEELGSLWERFLDWLRSLG